MCIVVVRNEVLLFSYFIGKLISVVNSGQFCGVAEMVSEVAFDKIFNYWWEDLKWSGIFKINWVYVQDVHHADVQHIRVNSTPINLLKDGSRVDFHSGKQMLEAFRTSDIDSDIFEDFSFMDDREEKLRMKRDSYLEMIRQLRNRGLIPEFATRHNNNAPAPYKNGNGDGHNKYQGGKRFGGNGPTRGRGGYRGGRGYKEREGGKSAYYPSHREGNGSEYVRKEEYK